MSVKITAILHLILGEILLAPSEVDSVYPEVRPGQKDARL
jgi:hypothetical protein